MQDEQQYKQLLLLYEQLRNGAEEISKLIAKEDYDSAITMIKSRESLFLNCKCIRRYLDLTPEQQKSIDKVFGELKSIEEKNMQTLENLMEDVQTELARTQKLQKIQKAYTNNNDNAFGSMVNVEK